MLGMKTPYKNFHFCCTVYYDLTNFVSSFWEGAALQQTELKEQEFKIYLPAFCFSVNQVFTVQFAAI